MNSQWIINEKSTESRFQHEINDINMLHSQVACFP